jgi:hypothetical protein
MSRLLLDLDIDLACSEFLRLRGYAVAQPVILMLDQGEALDAEWEQTARAVGEVGMT